MAAPVHSRTEHDLASDSGARRRSGLGSTVSGVSSTLRSSDAPAFRPICFRISNIPSSWSYGQVDDYLRKLEPTRQLQFQLSLYPSLSNTDGRQTALLNLSSGSDYFRCLDSHTSHYEKIANLEQAISSGEAEHTDLAIDSHFIGLTPLHTPKDIAAEYVDSLNTFI